MRKKGILPLCVGLALLAVFLDDGVRYLAFGEAIGPYCLF